AVGVVGANDQVVFSHVLQNIRQVLVHLTGDVDTVVFENVARQHRLRTGKDASAAGIAFDAPTHVIVHKRHPRRAGFNATKTQLGILGGNIIHEHRLDPVDGR